MAYFETSKYDLPFGLKIIPELTIKLSNLIRVKTAPLYCLGAKCINSALESICDTLSGFVHNTGKQMMVAIANAATPFGESHNISEDEDRSWCSSLQINSHSLITKPVAVYE